MNATRKKGRKIFQIFGSQGQSEFLVDNTLQWERRLEEKWRREEEHVEHLAMLGKLQECQELGKVIKYFE